ncbi:MAG TPA: aromatic acid decarboxylase, partial [Nitrospiraceae bacterium]|nr:aromatic acid decarboxylase [Nitrospiraceae bacterium]
MGTYTVAITGASGAPYALRVLQELIRGGHRVYVSITREGR